jgi:hypothetical protein
LKLLQQQNRAGRDDFGAATAATAAATAAAPELDGAVLDVSDTHRDDASGTPPEILSNCFGSSESSSKLDLAKQPSQKCPNLNRQLSSQPSNIREDITMATAGSKAEEAAAIHALLHSCRSRLMAEALSEESLQRDLNGWMFKVGCSGT